MTTEQNRQRDQAGRPIQKEEENFAPDTRPGQQHQQKPAQGGFDKTGRNPQDENTGDTSQKDRDTRNPDTHRDDKGMKR